MFVEEHITVPQEQKKKTIEASKISSKTLNKILQEQSVEGTKQQINLNQWKICSETKNIPRSPGKENMPIPITQDNGKETYGMREQSIEETWIMKNRNQKF